MDKLYEAAKFYQDNLVGKKFHLIAGKNKREIEFDIIFGVENIKHLLGLNKLEDLPNIQSFSSRILYRQILNRELTEKDIKNSEFFDLVEARLDNFKEIKAALNSKELMIKSLHGEFNSIRADYMLTEKNDEYGYAHLFLKGNDIAFPVTFIIHPNNAYFRNNPNKWKVLSIEEVKKQESRNSETIQQSTQKKTKK